MSQARTEKPGSRRGREGSGKQTTVDDPSRAAESAISPATSRALTGAAALVCREWPYSAHGTASPGDVRATVTALVESVRQALTGEEVRVGELPSFMPARRALEELRRAFLEQSEALDVQEESRSVVEVVRALERVQQAIDLDAAHRFAARLSGQDAQQLVVEMAHDMRSPLGSILILAERLRHGNSIALTPIQERQLGLIYSAAFGLSALAGDVIELARGGTTLLDQQPMPFSVSDVLQSILDILRPMAEEKRLTMRCTGPEADVRIGYQAALNRVLLNLATNALKFTNIGSVDVVCRQLDRTRIEFSVRDTGRGIPPYVLSNLFEAFRRRQIPGDYAFSSAGLGLSICQKLVSAMGGELKVETELEKGTRFYFELDLPQPSRL